MPPSPRFTPPDISTPSSLLLRRVFYGALAVFLGAMGMSLGGTLLLKLAPETLQTIGPLYPTLVKAPTWTYMAVLPVLSILLYLPQMRPRRLALFVAWGCIIGAGSELLGTITGFPFGGYAYTSWLGPKLFGHVPYFIPLSWFALSILCLDLAGRVTAHRGRRIALAALWMVLWDVSLDPAMSRAFPFWLYETEGFFYGMPLSNWAGWFGVSVVIMAGYERLGGVRPAGRWVPTLYALNCLFPLGLSLLYGLYGAVAAGLLATALPLWAAHRTRVVETPVPAAA